MGYITNLIAWIKSLIGCKHDFEVEVTRYTDTSFDLDMPSISYSASCKKCGKHHVRYVYGAQFTAEQVKMMCDSNKPPGKKYG